MALAHGSKSLVKPGTASAWLLSSKRQADEPGESCITLDKSLLHLGGFLYETMPRSRAGAL